MHFTPLISEVSNVELTLVLEYILYVPSKQFRQTTTRDFKQKTTFEPLGRLYRCWTLTSTLHPKHFGAYYVAEYSTTNIDLMVTIGNMTSNVVAEEYENHPSQLEMMRTMQR